MDGIVGGSLSDVFERLLSKNGRLYDYNGGLFAVKNNAMKV